MDQNRLEVSQDRIVLVLHEGGLPRSMSTLEAKRFAMDKTFGGLVGEVERLAGNGLAGEIVLQVREMLEVR
jgi:hypothetical protein